MNKNIMKSQDIVSGECGFVEINSKLYLLFNESEITFFDSKGDFDETLFDDEAENPAFGLVGQREKLYVNMDNVDFIGKHQKTVYLVLSDGKLLVSTDGKLESTLRNFGFDFPNN